MGRLLSICTLFLMSGPLYAGWEFGGGLGITAASQSDLNELRDRANDRASITTSSLGNAWEGAAFLGYRFNSSMIAWHLRGGFFYQSEDGKGSAGTHEYSVTGWTLFPMFRFYLLEDNYIKFFTQLGVGWGFMDGGIQEGSAKVDFSGSDFGYMAGLGAAFCFWGGSHCVTVEGNFRYLAVERLEPDSDSGSFSAGPPASLSQTDPEVELDGKDIGVTMSGIMGMIGYTYSFK